MMSEILTDHVMSEISSHYTYKVRSFITFHGIFMVPGCYLGKKSI
ncbi:hypothetical protein OAV88_02975 [bacterium]|nr:hypothetical protein [bacterium]